MYFGLPALLLAPLLDGALGYIPAQPTNDTEHLDPRDQSSLTIKWSNPPGVYSGDVSYQLRADQWTTDTTRGALVHFTEQSAHVAASEGIVAVAPWIAYVSCDQNETHASDWSDIFTLARDLGAVSALLYSLTSEACVLNQEYIDDFEKPLDVFATVRREVTQAFESQWRNTNETFMVFNAARLNQSIPEINATLEGKAIRRATYLGGVLTSRNGTAQIRPSPHPTPKSSDNPPQSSSKKNPGMIAVYVIAGFLAAMVCITVFSVIRRSRQPVSTTGAYIPGGYGNADPTPRRVGLGQAIVDTFPLQKFSKQHHPKELHSRSDLDLELPEIPAKCESTIASSSRSPMSDSRRTSTEDIAEDHCPICLLEFEVGDDLRVLPCEGQHRFHQTCVDPWLLRVSTSCPLCRKDFNPEVELDQSSEDESVPERSRRVTPRYLAMIRRARRRNLTASRARTLSSASEERAPRPREADQHGPGGY